MTEWSKVHDWKSCVGYPPTEGSNPSLSAIFILGWGSSSVGRALGSQSGGRGFDSHLLHQNFIGIQGRARWGDSGALYPQSAIAGSNSHPEVLVLPVQQTKSSIEGQILRNGRLLNPVRTGR